MNLINIRFGQFLILDKAPGIPTKSGKILSAWNCLCDCGNQFVAKTCKITTNKKKSCGCLEIKNAKIELKCVQCDKYDLSVELAHIKPIKSFPRSTKLGIVNAPENVVPLCRNHHWEYDHGYLKLDII